MRLLAIGPRFLGIRWGIVLGKRDLEKVFGSGTSAPFNPDTGSFLYVVKGEHGRVKVGTTSNPNERLNHLQTGSAHKLEFAWIGAPEGQAMGIEHDVHDMLDKYHCNGEWFTVTPDAAVGAISAVAQRRGVNILGCTPELAERIRQVGTVREKPRYFPPRWMFVLLFISVCAAVIALLNH